MIEASNLTRRFGDRLAVDTVSLRVPDGTILALLGPNGAGKTTTVRMLAGLLAPTEGEARVAGFDVRHNPTAVRARIGLVTDVPGLHEQMTLRAYLAFFASMYGLSAAPRDRRISELLAFFDLDAHSNERMVGFSKGMKQKAALARALLHEPSALFLDEPTSGLDPLGARAVRELIMTLKHASRSIILCTHDLDEAERLADQVAILRQGRIAVCDSPAALRAGASPETVVRVELAAACAVALSTLRAVPGVESPTLLASAPSITTTVLRYSTQQPGTVNPQAIRQLVAVGAEIVSITCSTRSLEQVYAETMGAVLPDGERFGSGVASPGAVLSAGSR